MHKYALPTSVTILQHYCTTRFTHTLCKNTHTHTHEHTHTHTHTHVHVAPSYYASPLSFLEYKTACHGSGCLLGSPCCPVISGARGLGNQCRSCSRNARIMSWFSSTCRSFPHSLICPYVLLLIVSRLFCPCSCLHVTLLSLPVPLLPCAAGLIARRSSSLCGPQTLPAGSGISTS